VALCPDVASYTDNRFDCCDLLQRSGIHDGAERKASSAVISTPSLGRNDRKGCLALLCPRPPRRMAMWSILTSRIL